MSVNATLSLYLAIVPYVSFLLCPLIYMCKQKRRKSAQTDQRFLLFATARLFFRQRTSHKLKIGGQNDFLEFISF